jgi:hypothetical protein
LHFGSHLTTASLIISMIGLVLSLLPLTNAASANKDLNYIVLACLVLLVLRRPPRRTASRRFVQQVMVACSGVAARHGR